MRNINSILLITAHIITSIIVIALGISLFIFPNSEISLELQSFLGIYVVFVLLCIFEPIKWFAYKEAIEFKHHKTILFYIIYGVILTAIGVMYQFYYLSLVGLLYIACYFILQRIPSRANVIVEKETDGQPLKSDSLFHPLPKKPDSE